jgi:hypothetical protein
MKKFLILKGGNVVGRAEGETVELSPDCSVVEVSEEMFNESFVISDEQPCEKTREEKIACNEKLFARMKK